MLKLKGVLSSNSERVNMIELFKVMNFRRMELADPPEGLSSNSSSVSSWDTSVVESEVIDVELGSLLL